MCNAAHPHPALRCLDPAFLTLKTRTHTHIHTVTQSHTHFLSAHRAALRYLDAVTARGGGVESELGGTPTHKHIHTPTRTACRAALRCLDALAAHGGDVELDLRTALTEGSGSAGCSEPLAKLVAIIRARVHVMDTARAVNLVWLCVKGGPCLRLWSRLRLFQPEPRPP